MIRKTNVEGILAMIKKRNRLEYAIFMGENWQHILKTNKYMDEYNREETRKLCEKLKHDRESGGEMKLEQLLEQQWVE